MTPLLLLAVCAAGGAGSVARWALDAAVRRRFPAARVPWATATANVTGSLLLGLLTGALGAGGSVLLAVAGTGFCGGFTTFSTAVVEVLRLRGQSPPRALAYAVGTLLAAVAAASTGTVAGALAAAAW